MLKNDRWIRKMSKEHDMINPFSEKQVREGVISYGSPRTATICASPMSSKSLPM